MKTVAVLGAGSCGLSAAWELAKNGYKVILLEEKDDIGGLTGRKIFNSNIYEYGTHVFHTNNQELKDNLKSLMKDYLFDFERGSRLYIKFGKKYFRYPLNSIDFVKSLPLLTLLHCSIDFVIYNILDLFKKDYKSAEDILIYKFGKKLYNIFFKDYTEKHWGIPTSELDIDLVKQRITRGDVFRPIKEFIEKLGLFKFIDSHPQTERSIGLLSYTKDGIWGICNSLAEYIKGKSGEIILNSKINKIAKINNKVIITYSSNNINKQLEADYLISTIPLPVFVNYMDEIPEKVLDASNKLKYRSLAVLGMLVKKKPVTNAICFYFTDKIFNRLDEPTNHGLKVIPDNYSIILAEKSCNYNDSVWNFEDDLEEKMIQDLINEGLLEKEDIVETHKLNYRYAYPIYHIGYKKDLNIILDYLNQHNNIFTTGRQGKFNYINMHVTMLDGINTSRKIIKEN